MDSNDQNLASTFKALRDAFRDAETAVTGQSDYVCTQTMRGLCEKAGKVLYSLIENGSVNLNGLPDNLRDEPTMILVVNDEHHDPPSFETEIDVDEYYWWAFVGWAGQQPTIPIILTEWFTRKTFYAYCPGGTFDLYKHRSSPDSRADWPQVCRASVQTIDYLLELVGATVETGDPCKQEHRRANEQVDEGIASATETELKPSEQKAYQSYVHACDKMTTPPEKDREAYDWLRENMEPDDYRLPAFETWQRQVRAGRNFHRTQQNSPRHGRTGRSVISHNDI